ncbi:SpoIIE family protein phosphatase [Pseudonocardia alaniniphila]|uniref:SpoIIE family protein phosphatase n=1 Tax=Pseudonocardia alaniniphila TaxID=75291 RepID=A0ABS9TIQ7_9PSEU|nr:SpoIIE family protein phosphatase [Pseudonocardia alaniniphila]MCH6168404.1 SpoIIE family protein phosphatase [Pseudonocardia alaniniphila]
MPDDLLAELVGLLPVGVFVLDDDGRVALWNPAAERLTGRPAGEMVGRSVISHGLADQTSMMFDAYTAARIVEEIRSGATVSGKLTAGGGSGGRLHFRVAPGPGSTTLGVLHDVGDKEASDEAFALLDALWETAPVGLAYFDTELRYRRMNGVVFETVGGSAEDRVGRTPAEVHGPVGATFAEGLRAVLADGRPRSAVPVVGRLWHGRGPFQEWRVHYYPVRIADGAVCGVGVVMEEVTAAERTRRALQESAAEREHALNRYQSLVEATSAAVWIREADGSARRDAPGLRTITGQTEAEHRGWGFLDAVHRRHRHELEAAWRAAAVAEPAIVFIRTYRLRTAGGGYRWFRMRAVPVHSAGRVVEWVGTETDVDDQMRIRERLCVLAEATHAMNAALDPEGELVALAEATVPQFADVCRVFLLDPDPLPPQGQVADGTPAEGPLSGRRAVTRMAAGVPPIPASAERFTFPPEHPLVRCVRSGSPSLATVPDTSGQWRVPQEQLQWGSDVAINSLLIAPVFSGGAVVAALMFLAGGDRSPYTADDLALVRELASRASAAVENAMAFQQSREVSLALQKAMLTEPPRYPGVEIEARYRPAAAQLQVGGDWYDAFTLPGGDLAVGVGDVEGHDLPAAVTMGQLRSMLRGLAHDSHAAPSVVLARLDRVLSGLEVTRFTTLVYGRLGISGGRAVFRWSNAGHPAPILVGPDGQARLLTSRVDLVLGLYPGTRRHDGVAEIPPGSTLLLYTDGLFERRRDHADAAGSALLDLVRRGVPLPLPEFCDHLVRGTIADTGDDIAVLALRVAESG